MAIEIGLGEVAALQEKLAAIVDNNGCVPDERLVQAHVIYGQVIGNRVFGNGRNRDLMMKVMRPVAKALKLGLPSSSATTVKEEVLQVFYAWVRGASTSSAGVTAGETDDQAESKAESVPLKEGKEVPAAPGGASSKSAKKGGSKNPGEGPAVSSPVGSVGAVEGVTPEDLTKMVGFMRQLQGLIQSNGGSQFLSQPAPLAVTGEVEEVSEPIVYQRHRPPAGPYPVDGGVVKVPPSPGARVSFAPEAPAGPVTRSMSAVGAAGVLSAASGFGSVGGHGGGVGPQSVRALRAARRARQSRERRSRRHYASGSSGDDGADDWDDDDRYYDGARSRVDVLEESIVESFYIHNVYGQYHDTALGYVQSLGDLKKLRNAKEATHHALQIDGMRRDFGGGDPLHPELVRSEVYEREIRRLLAVLQADRDGDWEVANSLLEAVDGGSEPLPPTLLRAARKRADTRRRLTAKTPSATGTAGDGSRSGAGRQ